MYRLIGVVIADNSMGDLIPATCRFRVTDICRIYLNPQTCLKFSNPNLCYTGFEVKMMAR